MGAAESAEEDFDAEEVARACCGFRVLGIQEKSPAAAAGFVSFLDFIMEANGIRLDTRDSTFMELIAQSEGQTMHLKVYNLKTQTERDVELLPTREWAGTGLLGVTIRFDSYEGAEDQLLHVLNVMDKSPAYEAGLEVEHDYLLGTPDQLFRDPEDLQDEILDAVDASFQCYVYNTRTDQVRIVEICPHDKWSDGDGLLGAEVGHGYLHRLPQSCRDTPGASVGFLRLPDNSSAATDPYCIREDVTAKEEDETQVMETPKEEEKTSLRYSARIDRQFPMSTVAVVADTSRLN